MMLPTPTPKQTLRDRRARQASDAKGVATSGSKPTKGSKMSHGSVQEISQRLEDSPYCTQQCLLGVAYDGFLDKKCPNFYAHGGKHLTVANFLRLVRIQLSKDREDNADCKPLYLSGSGLFKIRLSAHGYTLVAKGMEECDIPYLEREN